LLGVDETDEREEYCLTGRGFDDGGLSNSCSIEIDVGTFFCRFGCRVKVKKFNNIANEIR
jgi:hypothetical protein